MPAFQGLAARRTFRPLAVVLVIDGMLALVVRIVNAGEFASGQRDGPHWVALAGLAWLLIVVVVALRSAFHLRAIRQHARDADGRFSDLASQSTDWIWQSTPDLTIVYSSPGIERLLGYRPEEVVGRTFLDLLDPNERDRVHAIVSAAAAEGRGWQRTDARWRHADGRLVELTGSATPVLDGSGTLVGYRGVRSAVDAGARWREKTELTRRRVEALIRDGGLRIALQPIVDVRRDRWIGAEALARFPSGTPDQWFTEAHEAGVGVELEIHAAAQALERLGDLPDDTYLSLNISPTTAVEPVFAELVARNWARLGRVVIELTEHLSVSDYECLVNALAPARARGLRLAVDDTGAGYASFLHVVQLNPDIIKLDRSLLTGISCDPAKRAVVNAVSSLAREIGAAAVAEGVETGEEVTTALSLGVQLFQGFHFARPSTEPSTWSEWASEWASSAGLVPELMNETTR
jgi:PAS domain S-box-containing protein